MYVCLYWCEEHLNGMYLYSFMVWVFRLLFCLIFFLRCMKVVTVWLQKTRWNRKFWLFWIRPPSGSTLKLHLMLWATHIIICSPTKADGNESCGASPIRDGSNAGGQVWWVQCSDHRGSAHHHQQWERPQRSLHLVSALSDVWEPLLPGTCSPHPVS